MNPTIYPCSLDLVGDPNRGVLDLILDTNDTNDIRVNLTVDLAHVLRHKLNEKLHLKETP